jgi:hypothetical protein
MLAASNKQGTVPKKNKYNSRVRELDFFSDRLANVIYYYLHSFLVNELADDK